MLRAWVSACAQPLVLTQTPSVRPHAGAGMADPVAPACSGPFSARVLATAHGAPQVLLYADLLAAQTATKQHEQPAPRFEDLGLLEPLECLAPTAVPPLPEHQAANPWVIVSNWCPCPGLDSYNEKTFCVASRGRRWSGRLGSL